jgi:hypothetical protein
MGDRVQRRLASKKINRLPEKDPIFVNKGKAFEDIT